MLMLNVALVDMFGVDRFARSKGLLNVFAGVADLLATPFSGKKVQFILQNNSFNLMVVFSESKYCFIITTYICKY